MGMVRARSIPRVDTPHSRPRSCNSGDRCTARTQYCAWHRACSGGAMAAKPHCLFASLFVLMTAACSSASIIPGADDELGSCAADRLACGSKCGGAGACVKGGCPGELRIRALIDGQSQLVLRGKTVKWHVIRASAPGRWDGHDEATTLTKVSGRGAVTINEQPSPSVPWYAAPHGALSLRRQRGGRASRSGGRGSRRCRACRRCTRRRSRRGR